MSKNSPRSKNSHDSSAPRTTLADALGRCEAYAGTPGLAYVAEYLPGLDSRADAEWIVEQVNEGRLIACPRCHFLHLPARPFALGLAGGEPETGDACDVCPLVPLAAKFELVPESTARAVAGAAEALADSRLDRARAVCDLWIGGINGADALVWAAMAGGLDALRGRVAGAAQGAAGQTPA